MNQTEWPTHWPKYFNRSNQPCNKLIGVCCCGQDHREDEFMVRTMKGPPVKAIVVRRLPDGKFTTCSEDGSQFLFIPRKKEDSNAESKSTRTAETN